MPALPSALACQASRVSRSEAPLGCTAKSISDVVPPQAAARVPVSKSSAENVPPNGMSRWVCTSMPPGMTYLPVASIDWSARPAKDPVCAGSSRAATVWPSMSTSAANAPVAVTTMPPRMSMRMTAPLRLRQRTVAVRAPVPVELPQLPHLVEHPHVQVADHDLLGGVGGGPAHDLPARVGEVGLPVEVVVAERLDAYPVDRADEVLVGDRGAGLLQPPQVLRQPPARRRRVEDDLGAGQAERPPALGEMPLVADVDADPADRGVEHRVAEVAGAEVVLLPEPLHLRDVVLAVLTEEGAVGVDDRGGVVQDAFLLRLVDRHDEHHLVLTRDVTHQPHGRPVGHRLGPRVPLGLLHLAEVRSVEELLQAGDARALGGGVPDRRHRVFHHRVLVAGPLLLDQGGTYDVGHAGLLSLAGRPGATPPRVTIGRALKAHHLPGSCPGHHRPACLAISNPLGSAETVGAARGAAEDRFLLGGAEPSGEGLGRGADLRVAGLQGAGRPVGAEHEAVWAESV